MGAFVPHTPEVLTLPCLFALHYAILESVSGFSNDVFFCGGGPLTHRLASHAGIFREARISSLPTNACSTEVNIPFPRLANQVVLSKFWKVDLDRRATR